MSEENYCPSELEPKELETEEILWLDWWGEKIISPQNRKDFGEWLKSPPKSE